MYLRREAKAVKPSNVDDLATIFFNDLKRYNKSNFKTLERLDVDELSPTLLKSFSSVVTRFFIFAERHPELGDMELKMLYYKLNVDRVSRYFSMYPSGDCLDLKPFQEELRYFVKTKGGEI